MKKSKNVTFSLTPELIDQYRSYANRKVIASMNSAVKEALEEYAVKNEKDVLRKEMKTAALDL